LMEKEFARKHQVNINDVTRMNIKEDFMLRLKSGITLHIPLEEIESIARPACLACTDFANEYADISVGGLGSPDGFTTTLLRTIGSKRVFTEAVRKGYLEERTKDKGQRTKGPEDRVADRAEKSRILELVQSAAETKRTRGEERLCQMRT